MESIPKPPNPFVDEAGALTLPSFEDWFFLPGDWAIYVVSSRAPGLAQSLGLGPEHYGGELAGFAAWVLWVALAIASIAATAAVRNFDRLATRKIATAFSELRRHLRMAVVFARHRRKTAQQRREPTLDVEEQSLSRQELRVLELHARLAPGFALAVSDVAAELAVRVHEVRPPLDRLTHLKLLQSTVGGLDGETAYTVTSAGRAVLKLYARRPTTA